MSSAPLTAPLPRVNHTHHLHRIGSGVAQPRPGLSGLLYATTIPPLLGDWRVDRYEHGEPIEVANSDLLPRLGQLAVLGAVYGSASQYLLKKAPWNVGLPAWALLCAFWEGRKANDPLGQVQNGVQVALPLLVGGYVGAPLGQWAANWLTNAENKALFTTLNHPHLTELARAMADHQADEVTQRLNAATARPRRSWDDPGPSIQELRSEKAGILKANRRMLRELRAFSTHLQQHHLDQLPTYKTKILDLTGHLFREAGSALTDDQKTVLYATLTEAGKVLGSGSAQDDRTVAAYFNGHQAQILSQQLADGRAMIQASTLPPALKAIADEAMAPVQSLLAAPASDARQWFSPQQLQNRLDTLETLKTKLNDHLRRFDRPTMEASFARVETRPWLQALPTDQARSAAFHNLTQRFNRLTFQLADSQTGKVNLVKQGGPMVGFLVGAALVGNWLAKRINFSLADDFPHLARQRNHHPRATVAQAIDASYGRTFNGIDPGMAYLQNSSSISSNPASYVGWLAPFDGANTFTLHTPNDGG
jgi:hypothetical protein